MRTERLNEIFSSVKPSLVPLIQAIAASSAKKSYKSPEPLKVWDSELINQHFDVSIDMIHDSNFLPIIMTVARGSCL